MSIFQEPWWLDAVAPGFWREVVVEEGGRTVGRWPFCTYRKLSFATIGMAPLTPTLGPWIATRKGGTVARTRAEIEIVSELAAKLPRHIFFRQILCPSTTNMLPYQISNFSIGLEHTSEIDGFGGSEAIWRAMKAELRNQIRNAERHGTIRDLDDIDAFIDLNRRGLAARGVANFLDTAALKRLFEASLARDAVKLLAYHDHSGTLTAALYCAHGHGRMHHLLVARHPGLASGGEIDALTWHALKFSCERQLVYDFDGIPNRIAAQRQLKFGGRLSHRFILTAGHCLLLGARQAVKAFKVKRGGTERFC